MTGSIVLPRCPSEVPESAETSNPSPQFYNGREPVGIKIVFLDESFVLR